MDKKQVINAQWPGVIRSPNFPQPYPDGPLFQWNIMAPDDIFIQLNFITFEVDVTPPSFKDRISTPQTNVQMAKSWIFMKLGWVDPIMGGVDHVQYFCPGATLVGVAAHPNF